MRARDAFYGKGIVSCTFTPKSGEKALAIGMDEFSNRFTLDVPIDGYGRASIHVALVRQICSNGAIGYHRIFASDIPDSRNPRHTLERAIECFDHADGFAAIRERFDKLGLDPDSFKRFKSAVDAPHGLLLVTGPTGSGKTTTLYSALNELNNPDYNIVTVEDPVEFQIPGINQVPVKKEIGLTFAAALRSILRQDPDIIMLGEIRDEETAEIAVEAALTGHQVLSTMHCNDAAGAVSRLDDMGIAPFFAGIIGPLFGLRVYFALTMLALSAGLFLWTRRGH